MKKFKMFILMIMLVCFPSIVNAAPPVASTNMDYSSCLAFSDVFKTISTSEGSYYYKYCYRATCSYGVYNKVSMVANAAYRCQNGNGTPYTSVSSDGCSGYSGNCNTSNTVYCTKVVYVDCNKTSSGGTYGTPTTTVRPVAPVTTTTKKVTTTAKNTTVKTTTKAAVKTTTKVISTTTNAPVVTTEPVTEKPISLNIKSLKVNNTEIGYKNSKDSYNIKLPFGMDKVDVDVELEDDRANVTVTGNTDMPDEETSIIIEITGESDDKKTVTLVVNRYTEENNDCNLANIYIEDYNLDFSKTVYDYKLTLPKNVTSLDVNVVTVDEMYATYEVEGNDKLRNNSKIKVNVKAQDGTTCVYTIQIKKPNSLWKFILIVVVLVTIIGVSVYYLNKYMKKAKGKYKYE